MKRIRLRFGLIGVLALLVVGAASLAGPGDAFAKKKKKAGGTVNITLPLNQQIPNFTPPDTWGVLTSTFNVGKKFKGTVIRDVNARFQSTGSNPGSADDLAVSLTAPNGTTVWLFGFVQNGTQSIGPLTIDDESVNALQSSNPPALDPTELAPPFVGTAQPYCYQALGACALAAMDEGPVKGAWTLRAYDAADQGQTSVLNSWGISVQTGKPYKTS